MGSDNNVYEQEIIRQYFISIYHSVLLLTGNDILPVGDI